MKKIISIILLSCFLASIKTDAIPLPTGGEWTEVGETIRNLYLSTAIGGVACPLLGMECTLMEFGVAYFAVQVATAWAAREHSLRIMKRVQHLEPGLQMNFAHAFSGTDF